MNVALATAYIDAARAPRTRKDYSGFWRAWETWCSANDECSVPALPDTVASYVVDRADAGDRVSTIRCRLSAIAAYHEQHGEETPTRDANVRRIVRGIARQQADQLPAQVAGLTVACIERIEASSNPRSRRQVETVALCWVMHDALLRRSEACELRWEDIERDRDGSGVIRIRRSKTDQLGSGHIGYLSSRCMRWLQKIRSADSKCLVFDLHPSTVSRRLTSAARRAGIPGRIRGHSPRVGMAQELAENGATLVQMQQVGRWRSSEMPARYARKVIAKSGAVAQFYEGRRRRA